MQKVRKAEEIAMERGRKVANKGWNGGSKGREERGKTEKKEGRK